MKKCAFGILNTKDFQKDEVFANDRFTVTEIQSLFSLFTYNVTIYNRIKEKRKGIYENSYYNSKQHGWHGNTSS